jgi:uroporphyrin-3 C-methyltransferase
MTEATDTPLPAGAPSEEQRHAERRRGEQRRIARALWQGAIALLLSLLAVVVVAMLGWRQLSVERAIERDRAAGLLAGRDLDTIRTSIAKLEADAAASRAALAPLEAVPRRVDALGERVGSVEQRIEAPQRAVARTEATHLVELAGHRLALERDVGGAIRLFEAAAARLAALSDPTTLAVRAQLERDLAALRAVREPNVDVIGARLAAAGTAVRDLPMLGMIKEQYLPPGEPPATESGWARAWQQLRVLGDLVTVRRVSDAAVQLVSMEEIGVRRHHLETLLFAARLAALRGDDTDYAASVSDARDWLERFFDIHDPKGRAVDAELSALAKTRVSPDIPDVSGSVKLLRRAGK